MRKNQGNIALITLVALFLLAVLSLSLSDLLRVYRIREEVKNATDAAALALAQDLLFFEHEGLEERAEDILAAHDCFFVEMLIEYDSVSVTGKKGVEYLLLGKVFSSKKTVYGTSKTMVTFPWDESLGKCKSLLFDF